MSSEETKKSTESDLTGSGQSKHAESQKPADNCDKNKTNKSTGDSQGACYCGKDRNLNIVELLCASCSRWFHESCISYQLGKLVPFMTNYLFICKNCSPTGLETFKKNQAPFPQMCVTAIANLQQESAKAGANKLLFSKDREIIPFIDQYWEAMTTMPRRVTQSWYATVQRALQKEVPALFTAGGGGEGGGAGAEGGAGDALYGLAEPPASVRPNYDHMIRQGQLKVTDMGVAAAARGGRGGGRAAGARLPQRAPVQQGRLPLRAGRAGPARALPPGVRREPRVERQAHPRLAVPRAVPRRRAAGAARPRAAAARGRRPPGVLGRARLLRRARLARRGGRRLVLGGARARARRGRRRAAGLGAALRLAAGAAGLRPLRLQLAQPQGHALPRVARPPLRRGLRRRRRAGLPAGAAGRGPRAALAQGPAAGQVQEPPVLRGARRGGGGGGGAAPAAGQPHAVLPERPLPGRGLRGRVRGPLLPGREPAPQHHRVRQLRARVRAPARRLRLPPDVGARGGGHLRADAGRRAVPGRERGQAAPRPLQPLTHVAAPRPAPRPPRPPRPRA